MKILHAVLALLLITQPLQAQRLVAPPDAKERVDRYFERFNGGPGCAVGASLDGRTVLTAGYGLADLERRVPITAETIFEPGSVSKQFAAAAVLLLEQQGKLSLDDPVRKYIPELPDYGTPLTIRHLIHHTSGLRDWGSVAGIAGWPRGTVARTHDDVLDIVSRQQALNHPPGAEYSYTNTGYNLAAILVGRVAGKSFADFTRDAIFAPLGMSSSSWRDDFRRIVPNRALAYSPDFAAPQPAAGTAFVLNMPFENVYGNGGMLTTVGDLLRWNANFTDPTVGGRALVENQLRRGVLNDGRAISYAAGVAVGSWRGVAEISHSGATAGYGGWLARYPDQGLSVAILCNVSNANPMQLGRDVAALYLDRALKPPPPAPAAVDVRGLDAVAGLYRNLRDHTAVLAAVDNGRLRIGGALFTPISADTFVDGESRFVAEAGRLRAGDGRLFEKVDAVNPTVAELQELAGEYRSEEAQATLRIEVQGVSLMLQNRAGSWTPLRPTYRDAFAANVGVVRFLRDASGTVTGLSVHQDRVWDLRFVRRPG
jgi:CubicO group peptidase (beta-lactamase class C family)